MSELPLEVWARHYTTSKSKTWSKSKSKNKWNTYLDISLFALGERLKKVGTRCLYNSWIWSCSFSSSFVLAEQFLILLIQVLTLLASSFLRIQTEKCPHLIKQSIASSFLKLDHKLQNARILIKQISASSFQIQTAECPHLIKRLIAYVLAHILIPPNTNRMPAS